jgi:transposase
LLLRGVCKGESSPVLAEELGLSRQSVHTWRKRLQENGHRMLDETPLKDRRTETDEMFQNAGEKRRKAPQQG